MWLNLGKLPTGRKETGDVPLVTFGDRRFIVCLLSAWTPRRRSCDAQLVLSFLHCLTFGWILMRISWVERQRSQPKMAGWLASPWPENPHSFPSQNRPGTSHLEKTSDLANSFRVFDFKLFEFLFLPEVIIPLLSSSLPPQSSCGFRVPTVLFPLGDRPGVVSFGWC